MFDDPALRSQPQPVSRFKSLSHYFKLRMGEPKHFCRYGNKKDIR